MQFELLDDGDVNEPSRNLLAQKIRNETVLPSSERGLRVIVDGRKSKMLTH